MKENELIIENNILKGIDGEYTHNKIDIPFGVKEIDSLAFINQPTLKEVIIPNSVIVIKENAFNNCKNLTMVYIPSSVIEIEKNAFIDCPNLEIYCQAKPQSGWIDTTEIKEVEETCITPEDDAFNFHRSSGGWSYTTYTRKIETQLSWNPNNYKVHTNYKLPTHTK